MKTFRGKRILTPPSQRTRSVRVVHPVIREIWQMIDARPDVTVGGTARCSGLDETTLRNWRRGASAQIANVEAVLNTMGLKLAIVCVDKEQ